MNTCVLGETGIVIPPSNSQDIIIRKEKFNRFLHDQIKEILKHKWIESEKAHKDLCDEACIDWIMKYADKYREEWEERNGKL